MEITRWIPGERLDLEGIELVSLVLGSGILTPSNCLVADLRVRGLLDTSQQFV